MTIGKQFALMRRKIPLLALQRELILIHPSDPMETKTKSRLKDYKFLKPR